MPNPMDLLIALILKISRNGIMVFGKLFVQDFPTDPEGFFLVKQPPLFYKTLTFQLLPTGI
jgi:hypothetical protein